MGKKIEIKSEDDSVYVCDVNPGDTLSFEATGKWTDWFIRCDADGYENPFAKFLGIRPAYASARWFALVGEVGGAQFLIGARSQRTFKTGGTLNVFANDLPSMRWNNKGSVDLVVRAADPKPPCEPEPPVKPGWWARNVELLRRTRGFGLIALLLIVTGAALSFSDQGKDLVSAVVQSMTEPAGSRYLTMLCLAAVTLGLQAWFWTRAIVEFQFEDDADWRSNPFLVWTPRVLGLMPFLFLLLGVLLLAGAHDDWDGGVWWPVGTLLASGAAVLSFVIFRTRVAARLRSLAKTRRTGAAVARTLLSLKAVLLIAGLAVAALSLAAVLASKFDLPVFVGPAAVVLFAISNIIPVVALLAQMGVHYRVPFISAWLVLAALFSLTNDNHGVRVVTGTHAIDRDDVKVAFAKWYAQARHNGDTTPIIFVAAEGGASRAAFWTGHALANLEEKSGGDFSNHVFMISAISGSDLGAGAFVTTLADNPNLVRERRLVPAVDDYTGKDYLSPTLAGMLYPDLLQRFVPGTWFPDRAEYLERAWEAGWTEHCSDNPGMCGKDRDAMSRAFLDTWPRTRSRWVPILTIGGAREEDGRRILTSSVGFDGSQIDADDFHARAGEDVRMSTAMLNGARFPFVSPAGTLPRRAGGHIVDGGYFDAAGIETMREMADTVMASVFPSYKGAQGGLENAKLRPVFLLLENGAPRPADPPKGAARGKASRARNGLSASYQPPSPTHRFAQDMLDAVTGLLSSRDAHAAHLRSNLQRELGAPGSVLNGAEIVEIRVCKRPPDFDLPLDWVLSSDVRKWMARAADVGHDDSHACDNAKAIGKIMLALSGRTSPD